MIEIGTDLVLVSRMEKSLQIPGFAERVFSQPERAYCKTTESFAGIFAAKEAYYKALGTGLQLPLNALTVLHDDRVSKIEHQPRWGLCSSHGFVIGVMVCAF